MDRKRQFPSLTRSPISIFLVLSVLMLQSCSLQELAESATQANAVLFQDDFADPGSGWLQGQDDIGLAEYYNGGFRIAVNSDTAAKVSIPRLQLTDVRIEVNATKISGPNDNEFGIVCRYLDENNFYFFTISSDGYYGIGKYKDNQLHLIGMEKMQTNDLIRQGESTNHLRADCVKTSLRFYINGEKVADVQDSDFSKGDVGLLAGTFRNPGVDIFFDNFSVQKPEL
jgi:hypothetical protein